LLLRLRLPVAAIHLSLLRIAWQAVPELLLLTVLLLLVLLVLDLLLLLLLGVINLRLKLRLRLRLGLLSTGQRLQRRRRQRIPPHGHLPLLLIDVHRLLGRCRLLTGLLVRRPRLGPPHPRPCEPDRALCGVRSGLLCLGRLWLLLL